MMTHVEGPIVDSFYDMSLCSWNKRLEPPLPSYNSPNTSTWKSNFQQPSNNEAPKNNGVLLNDGRALIQAKGSFGESSERGNHPGPTSENFEHRSSLPEHSAKDPHYDPDIEAEFARAQSVLEPSGSENRVNTVTRHLSKLIYF